jgi:hypothetical protein
MVMRIGERVMRQLFYIIFFGTLLFFPRGLYAIDEWRVMPIRSEAEYETDRVGGEAEQHMHSITRCQSHPEVVYLSHDCGQIWKSTDNGRHWEKPLGIGLSLPFGQSIEVDPYDPDRVFTIVSANWNWLDPNEQGLYRSVDGGQRWDHVLQPEVSFPYNSCQMDQHAIAYDILSREENQIRRWYAAFPGDRLYVSEDFGQTWQKLAALNDHVPVYQVLCHPTDSCILYLSTSQGLFKSKDQGQHLETCGNLPAGGVSSIAVNRSNPSNVYVTLMGKGLYKSVDSGNTFQLLRSFDAWRVEMNPGYPQILYLSGLSSNTIVSHDGGSTWITDMFTQPALGLERPGSSWKGRIAGQLTGIAPNPFNPNEAIAYSRATLWKTVDGGRVFFDSSMMFTGYYWGWGIPGMAFDRFDPDRLFFFNCDVGMTITKNGGDWFDVRNSKAWDWYQQGLLSWIGTYCGDVLPEPGSNVIVASVGDYWNNELMRSEDEGCTWTLLTHDAADIFFISFHPKDPNIVYAGNKISYNKGVTFERIQFGEFDAKEPTLVGMCRSVPDTIYAMDDNDRFELYRSDDRGRTWRLYSKPGWRFCRLDLKPIFAVDPADPNIIYTRDANKDLAIFDGQTWRSTGVLMLAGGTEINNFVRCIAVDSRYPRIIYAGMFAAGRDNVWRSCDKGYTWKNISYNSPRLSVDTLAVSPHTGELFRGSPAGTWVLPPPYSSQNMIYNKLIQRPVDWKFDLTDFSGLSKNWLSLDLQCLSIYNLNHDESIDILDLNEFVNFWK